MLDRFFGEVMRKTMLNMTYAELGDHEEWSEPESGITTDLKRTGEHEPITWDLIRTVEHSPELKALLQESIRKAEAINPDRNTNPVYSLESYYAFIDRAAMALPWAITPSEEYSDLYDRIDQSMGCFYFVCDQPLEALADKGYYHNSLMYHEPFRSWLVRFTAEYGAFLNTEDSFQTHVLRDFHCIGTPWGDHFTTRSDKETFHGVTIIEGGSSIEPFQLINLIVIKYLFCLCGYHTFLRCLEE